MGHAEVAAGPPPRRVGGPALGSPRTVAGAGRSGDESRARAIHGSLSRESRPKPIHCNLQPARPLCASAQPFYPVDIGAVAPNHGMFARDEKVCPYSPGFWGQVVMNWGPLAVEARDSQMEPRSRTGAPFRPATTPGDVIGGQSSHTSVLTASSPLRWPKVPFLRWPLGISAYAMASLCSRAAHSIPRCSLWLQGNHGITMVTRVRSDSQFGAHLLGGAVPAVHWTSHLRHHGDGPGAQCMADLGLHVTMEGVFPGQLTSSQANASKPQHLSSSHSPPLEDGIQNAGTRHPLEDTEMPVSPRRDESPQCLSHTTISQDGMQLTPRGIPLWRIRA